MRCACRPPAPIVNSTACKCLGPQPKSIRGIRVALVISHCATNVEKWLDMAYILQDCGAIVSAVHLYSKCGMDLPVSFGVQVTRTGQQVLFGVEVTRADGERTSVPIYVTRIPNYGMCDHTYVYHLARNAHNDDETDVVVFFKDTSFRDAQLLNKSGSSNRSAKICYMLARAAGEGFSCGRGPYRFADANAVNTFRWYTKVYKPTWTDIQSESDVDFFNPRLPTLLDFINKLPTQSQLWLQERPVVPMCYGGSFAVKRDFIQRAPGGTALWQSAEKALSRGRNIVEAHYMERLWATLLSDPVPHTTAAALLCSSKLRPTKALDGGVMYECPCDSALSRECRKHVQCALARFASQNATISNEATRVSLSPFTEDSSCP